MTQMIFLLVLFHLKHFLADYPLQTPYMLKKFLGGWDWVKPLAAHCYVHALFTWCIAYGSGASAYLSLGVACLDFTIHFIMDRIKASPNMLGRYKAMSASEYKNALHEMSWKEFAKPRSEIGMAAQRAEDRMKGNTYFWWALGFDQMIHGLTDLLVVAILCGAL